MSRSGPKIELNLVTESGSTKDGQELETSMLFTDQEHANKVKQKGALFLEMVIEGDEYYGLVDTGASDCFMSKATRDKLPSEAIWDVYPRCSKMVRLGDSSRGCILETIKLKTSFDGIIVYYEFHIMEEMAHEIILGRNLLRDLRAEVKPAQDRVLLFVGNPVSITQGTLLKPHEEKLVRVAPWETVKGNTDDVIRLEPSGISIAGIEHAINYSQRTWWLKIANFTEHHIFVDRNDVVAYVEWGKVEPLQMDTVRDILELDEKAGVSKDVSSSDRPTSDDCQSYHMQIQDDEQRKAKADKIRELDLGATCMNDDEQKRFKDMLVQNMDAIALSMEELGHCEWSPMKIRVDESQGVCTTRPYRYSPQKMDIIDEQVQMLLKLGIIEPSESAWRSPLVVVQKKDGHARLCTDYRVLN